GGGLDAGDLLKSLCRLVVRVTLNSGLSHHALYSAQHPVNGVWGEIRFTGQDGPPPGQGGRIERGLWRAGKGEIGAKVAAIHGDRRRGELSRQDRGIEGGELASRFNDGKGGAHGAFLWRR